jgi:hypothetical protein
LKKQFPARNEPTPKKQIQIENTPREKIQAGCVFFIAGKNPLIDRG